MRIIHNKVLNRRPIGYAKGKYVCTTELEVPGLVFDIYLHKSNLRDNEYFGINDTYVVDADSVKEKIILMIKGEDGNLYYSRYNHDYVVSGEAFIDGGRFCPRSNSPCFPYKVFGHKLVPVEK